MHQREICLCPDCIRRELNEAPEDERRAFAKCWINSLGARRHPAARIVAVRNDLERLGTA